TFPAAIRSAKIEFIKAWNVAGELVSPNSMTRGSNRPRSWTVNAAFHSSPSLMRTLW
ncbi:hypothetical protein DICSQDRAFT_73992, partial [Dichomitus squalens LYAD-421 SS1]